MKQSESQKTAVVIGSTGLVGSELIKQLIACDEIGHIIALSRRPLSVRSEKLETHIIDFANLDQHKDLIKGHLFFSCLGTTRKQAGSTQAQRVVDFDYQLKAAEIAEENGIPHYLLVSSSGANASSFSSYMKMKGELEEAVKRLNFDRISIFQPSLLLGQREKSRLGEDTLSKVLPFICKIPGLRKMRPVQGGDVARKMLEVSLSQNSGIETFRLDELFP